MTSACISAEIDFPVKKKRNTIVMGIRRNLSFITIEIDRWGSEQQVVMMPAVLSDEILPGQDVDLWSQMGPLARSTHSHAAKVLTPITIILLSLIFSYSS